MKQHWTDAYHELCAYTLAHGDAAFIHQHVVDAFAAQTADANTKPIGITFALVGLYLHCEKGFTGKEVQRAHMTLAKQKRTWPSFVLPANRGDMTVADVLAIPPRSARDEAIHRWCCSVWSAYASARETLVELLRQYELDERLP